MPTLSIDIEARLAKFQDGLDQVARNAGRSAGQIDRAFKSLRSTMASLAGVAIGGFVVTGIKRTIDDLAALNDGATQAGTSVESLSSLLNTLSPTGVGLPEIVDLTGKIVKAMGQAENATSKQAKAFAALGVATKDANGNLRGADDVLADVAKELAKYEDGANKVAIAQALLEESGARYLPILGDLATRARANASVTSEQARAADDLADSIGDITTAFTILRQELVAGVAPALSDFFKRYIALAKLGKGPVDMLDGLFGDSPDEKIAGFERRIADLTRIREQLAQDGDPSVLQRAFNPALRTRDDIDQELIGLAGDLEQARQVKRQMDELFAPSKSGPRPTAPVVPTATQTRSGSAAAAAKSVEDFEARVNAAVARLFENAPIAKARELEAVLVRLDELFAAGIDPGIYGQAVGETLSGLVENGKSAADALAELDKRFFDGKLSVEAYDEAVKEIFRTTAQVGRDGQADIEALAESWRDAIDPLRKYARQLEEIKRLEGAAGGLTPEEAARARGEVQGRANEEIHGVKDQTDEVTDAARELGMTFTSAFEDAIVEGKGLRDVLTGLEQDILRIITRKLVTEPLANALTGVLSGALGGIFGGGAGAPISASIPTTIIPGRASGGPVSAGRPYMVGEAGPELFVPKIGGDIVPNGAGGTVVQMTVVAQDAESFRRSEGQIATRLSGALSRGGRYR